MMFIKHVLFICSRNEWRSRTAEEVFKNLPTVSVRSAGTSPSARRKISQDDLLWADTIYVMEKDHQVMIQKKFGREFDKKIIVLNIPDEYEYMNPELIEILKETIRFE